MKKIFNLANGIFFLSLFSVIFLTLNLQSGKMGSLFLEISICQLMHRLLDGYCYFFLT
ncbi:hypothetical protein [Enterococcus lactis]|uniref:hypothetical protein n=1 Tax=Enterococcus lactis TaxID=357441 RepID=UPI003D9A7E51